MIKDFKKIKALLHREQKRALIILSGLLLVGMFFEILGLGMLLPILTILLNPDQLSKVLDYITFVDHSLYTYTEVVVFSLFSLFFVYIFKTLFLVFINYKQNVILENILEFQFKMNFFQNSYLNPMNITFIETFQKLLKMFN